MMPNLAFYQKGGVTQWVVRRNRSFVSSWK